MSANPQERTLETSPPSLSDPKVPPLDPQNASAENPLRNLFIQRFAEMSLVNYEDVRRPEEPFGEVIYDASKQGPKERTIKIVGNNRNSRTSLRPNGIRHLGTFSPNRT